MKLLNWGAAINAAIFSAVTITALTANSVSHASTVECKGPLRECAIAVGAFCEVENGKLMIWYKDREGQSNRFEECVGKVYEKHGRPNPYRPKPTQNR